MKKLLTILFILFSFGAMAQTMKVTIGDKATVKVAADAKIASIKWTKVSGPIQGTIVNDASIATDVTGCVIGVYKFQLTVTDNFGMVGSSVTTVTISRDGVPPSVDAGPDQNLVLKIILGAIGLGIIGFFVFKKNK